MIYYNMDIKIDCFGKLERQIAYHLEQIQDKQKQRTIEKKQKQQNIQKFLMQQKK